MFGKNLWKSIFIFSSTFLLSTFLAGIMAINETPKQKTEQKAVLLENTVENNIQRKCSEIKPPDEINRIAQTRIELIQRKLDLQIGLENSKNAAQIEKNNLHTLIAGLKKQIVELEALENRSKQYKKDRERKYTAPQNLLYLEKCYEF